MFHKFHHFTRIEPDWAYWDAPGVIFSGTKAGSVRAPGLLFFNYLLPKMIDLLLARNALMW